MLLFFKVCIKNLVRMFDVVFILFIVLCRRCGVVFVFKKDLLLLYFCEFLSFMIFFRWVFLVVLLFNSCWSFVILFCNFCILFLFIDLVCKGFCDGDFELIFNVM